jgi:hypothetical protein
VLRWRFQLCELGSALGARTERRRPRQFPVAGRGLGTAVRATHETGKADTPRLGHPLDDECPAGSGTAVAAVAAQARAAWGDIDVENPGPAFGAPTARPLASTNPSPSPISSVPAYRVSALS